MGLIVVYGATESGLAAAYEAMRSEGEGEVLVLPPVLTDAQWWASCRYYDYAAWETVHNVHYGRPDWPSHSYREFWL